MTLQALDGMSTSQTARELGLSPSRIIQMLNNGDLPYTTTVLGRLIERKAVMELKAQRELVARQNQQGGSNGLEAA